MIYLKFTFVLLVILLAGCSKEAPPPNPTQQARLIELREKLRQELGAKYDQPVPEATQAQLERGAKLYEQLCASCHGVRGDGQGHTGAALATPPPALSDPEQARLLSEQARLHVIEKGVPGTAMMGWENLMTEADIVSVYVYIRSFVKNK